MGRDSQVTKEKIVHERNKPHHLLFDVFSLVDGFVRGPFPVEHIKDLVTNIVFPKVGKLFGFLVHGIFQGEDDALHRVPKLFE